MSLQNLAHHMQTAGRGGDSMLVHMTPKEVGGLQALAMAHGGSLTINPETGLPEAGFLSRLLPTLIGAGLAMTGVGAPMAALMVGGGYGLAKGSLKEGLMAGLGAYGGAGLGAGLSAAGTGASFVDDAVMAGGAPVTAKGQITANQVIANKAIEEAAKAPFSTAAKGLGALTDASGRSAFMSGMSTYAPYSSLAAGTSLLGSLTPEGTRLGGGSQKALIRPYTYERTQNPEAYAPSPTAYSGQPFRSSEQNYFTDKFTALDPYTAPGPEYKAAAGGLTALAVGGPVETMSAMNAVGQNLGYPQSQFQTDIYSNPNVQRPETMNMIAPSGNVAVDPYTGEQKFDLGGAVTAVAEPQTTGGYNYSYNPKTQEFTQLSAPTVAKPKTQSGLGMVANLYNQQQQQQQEAQKPFVPVVTGGIAAPAVQSMQPVQAPEPIALPAYESPEQQLGLTDFYDYMNQQLAGMRGEQRMASGGISHLGDYSDGGRLLRGPGDGVSDSIPASIGGNRPARLADGEFVVPARIVSEIGNGSTEAGARKLYAMMDRVQKARKKSVGQKKVAVDSKAEKYLPA